MNFDFLKPLLEGLVRRLLQALGGALVGAGIVTDADWLTISAGLATWIITYVWGLLRSDLPRVEGRVS